MPLPTDAELRQAMLALGKLAAAGRYYDAIAGESVLSSAELQGLEDALAFMVRGRITPLEVIDRTTALPLTSFFTATRQGVYLVLGYFVLTTAASTGTATLALAWNDGRMAQSENQLTSVPITGTGQRSFVKAVVLGAGQSISASLTPAGVTGSPVYSIYARILEL